MRFVLGIDCASLKLGDLTTSRCHHGQRSTKVKQRVQKTKEGYISSQNHRCRHRASYPKNHDHHSPRQEARL